MGGSHLKKVSENETWMYTLCTLNGKELDTGHNSSPNSALSYWAVMFTSVDTRYIFFCRSDVIWCIKYNSQRRCYQQENKIQDSHQVSNNFKNSLKCVNWIDFIYVFRNIKMKVEGVWKFNILSRAKLTRLPEPEILSRKWPPTVTSKKSYCLPFPST